MDLYLNILSVVLLGLVAGLLMALWWQLRDWKASVREAPLLAETMAEQLMAARRGLEELKKNLVAHGPELSGLLSEGGKVRVELQFLLQRAEQLAAKLEAGQPPRRGEVVAMVEEVAGANGKAVQLSEPSHDPLEDLLAGLQQKPDNVTPMRKPGRKRMGPVTQAELELQQKVAG
ncbi:MAG: hypothetical protein GC129_03105 [Proteobacteria bacterium]|nr:hypothetical protein [Pseudomonadota bacterium]